jgi:hypothetical protein
MLKELLISVASGVIVALVLQMFRFGGRSSEPRRSGPRQTMYAAPPPARRSGGGFSRFILAVVGGLVLAFFAAPMVIDALHGGGGGRGGWGGGGGRGRFYDGGGPGGYFDRGGDSIFGLPPMLVLTIIGTILVWMVLSAFRRR